MNVLDVYEKAREAIDSARRGEGPVLLECSTYRYRGHSRFEKAEYRPDGEVEAWKERDPIVNYRARLTGNLGIATKEIERIEAEVSQRIDDAVKFAEESPEVDPSGYKQYIFAPSEERVESGIQENR
jgi:pyruvate dehydrogenase E1 component alpha subunit